MRLIVELYVNNQIPEGIIVTCINSLFEDINNQSVEILCQMMEKISEHVVKRAIAESTIKEAPSSASGSAKKPKKTLSTC